MPKILHQAYTLAHLQETTLKSLQQEPHPDIIKKLPPLLPTPNHTPKFQAKPTLNQPGTHHAQNITSNNT